MHIEKNACDNLIWMLLGVAKEINDNLKVSLDMKAKEIRTLLHPLAKTKG